MEITAAGTVQDFHLVPYYPSSDKEDGTIIRTNIGKSFAIYGNNLINTAKVGSICYF